jgi:hypothetical protein
MKTLLELQGTFIANLQQYNRQARGRALGCLFGSGLVQRHYFAIIVHSVIHETLGSSQSIIWRQIGGSAQRWDMELITFRKF